MGTRAIPLLALALAACAPQAAHQHDVVADPRVVSLNPCTDAILAEVADPGQILALSHYSRDPAASSMDPAQAARWPATRGTVEAVLALEPDLVLASTYLDPASKAAFARLGLKLEQVGVAASVQESRAQVRRIARLVGHPERGEALVRRIDAALAAAAPPAGHKPISTVVWQQGGLVPGDATLIADLLRRTGFASDASARGLGQGDILGLEATLADPPQVLLRVTDHRQSGRSDRLLLGHPVLGQLEQTRVATLDPRLNYCGGPTIVRAARRLAAIRRAATRSAS